jgi:hypothetical protein
LPREVTGRYCVFSASLSRRHSPSLDRHVTALLGNQLFIASATVAELRYDTIIDEMRRNTLADRSDIEPESIDRMIAAMSRTFPGAGTEQQPALKCVNDVSEIAENAILDT